MRNAEDTIMGMQGQTPGLPTKEDQAEMSRLEKEYAAAALQVLPPSPGLKCRHTGRIYPWTASLAKMGRETFTSCDENGNEDPAAWQGRWPKGFTPAGVSPEPASPASREELSPPVAEAVAFPASGVPEAAPPGTPGITLDLSGCFAALDAIDAA